MNRYAPIRILIQLNLRAFPGVSVCRNTCQFSVGSERKLVVWHRYDRCIVGMNHDIKAFQAGLQPGWQRLDNCRKRRRNHRHRSVSADYRAAAVHFLVCAELLAEVKLEQTAAGIVIAELGNHNVYILLGI